LAVSQILRSAGAVKTLSTKRLARVLAIASTAKGMKTRATRNEMILYPSSHVSCVADIERRNWECHRARYRLEDKRKINRRTSLRSRDYSCPSPKPYPHCKRWAGFVPGPVQEPGYCHTVDSDRKLFGGIEFPSSSGGLQKQIVSTYFIFLCFCPPS
jgi:hypothetical protein